VLTVLRRYGSHLGSFSEDHLRNLSLYRKENTGNKPLLMLDAHSDEVGFMVHSISPDGTLRLAALGGMGHLYYYCNRHGLFKRK
jgi:putative aminopeptidase FrvX